MPKDKILKATLNAKGTEIAVFSTGNDADYISLTDIAKYKNPEFPADVVKNWLRSKSTIEFLGLWEQLNNQDFKLVEFDQFKNQAGENTFVLSPQKWVEATNAIGLISKSGRYGGGTYAHKDIAFEFASWVSPEFKLYIIKDYQRLKTDENCKLSLEWNVNRVLAKLNYKIHTDAIVEAFVNGIPLVVIELKSASDEKVDITDAYNQLQTYKITIPTLFTYNSFMVTSDGINARAGTLSVRNLKIQLLSSDCQSSGYCYGADLIDVPERE